MKQLGIEFVRAPKMQDYGMIAVLGGFIAYNFDTKSIEYINKNQE